MHRKAKCGLGLVLVCALILSACSAQKSLARRLAGADCVIFSCNWRSYEDRTITVTGGDVGSILKAIAAGEKQGSPLQATPDYRLEFFRGHERLGAITNSGSIFWIKRKAYLDPTGTLEKLERTCVEKHPPRLAP